MRKKQLAGSELRDRAVHQISNLVTVSSSSQL
jgi:hypothetical protein